MKCRYCNAEVAPNAKFCTTCGGDLSKFDKCVSCGEYIDKGITKCPHCGAEQPQIVQHQEGSPSKGLWIIGTILLLGILGGGGYYFLNNMDGNHSYVQETDSIEEVVDSLIDIENIHSVEGINRSVSFRLHRFVRNGTLIYIDHELDSYYEYNN